MVDKPEKRDSSHEASAPITGRDVLSDEYLSHLAGFKPQQTAGFKPQQVADSADQHLPRFGVHHERANRAADSPPPATQPAATQPSDKGHPVENSKLFDQMKALQPGSQPMDVLKWAGILHAMGDKPDPATLQALEKNHSLPQGMSKMLHDNPALAHQINSQDFQNYIQQQINKGFRGF